MKKTMEKKPKFNPMDSFCEQAGCSEKERRIHAWKWNAKRWHSHPLPTFAGWFEPSGTDPESGASVGGHADAYRVWSRKTSGGYKRRRYGISTIEAWNVPRYVAEFNAWVEAGSPERETEFVSLAAPLEKQREIVTACIRTIFEGWTPKKKRA